MRVSFTVASNHPATILGTVYQNKGLKKKVAAEDGNMYELGRLLNIKHQTSKTKIYSKKFNSFDIGDWVIRLFTDGSIVLGKKTSKSERKCFDSDHPLYKEGEKYKSKRNETFSIL